MSPATTAKHSSWSYAEQHAGDDPLFAAVRARAGELGVGTVTEGTAAALQVLAAARGARAIVELGTGLGLSGVALLRGAPQAVLTTIDADADHVQQAREVFQHEGLASSRTRLITGRAEEVLPRLTTGGYDMVFTDIAAESTAALAGQCLRLLRPGSVLVVNDALHGDRVPKPAVRDPQTQAMRALGRTIRDDERMISALLPTGTGLLVAVTA